MQYKAILSLADAQHMLDAAQAEAEANGWPVSIAVVDDGGHLLAMRRLDGAAAMGCSVAQHKARSAALGRKETQVFEEMINGGRMAYLSLPGLEATMTGGVPVLFEEQIIGAIGVSGAKPDQDVQMARAGLAVFNG